MKNLENLQVHANIDTPRIELDASTGYMSIEGKSFPPDVSTFYKTTLDWISLYMVNPAEKTVVNLKLDYFNTASSKIILDILYKFEEIYKNGANVVVKWHYPEDDEDMEETGVEYAEIVNVPFEQVGYTFIFD